jgi:paraquat-inducible protein A
MCLGVNNSFHGRQFLFHEVVFKAVCLYSAAMNTHNLYQQLYGCYCCGLVQLVPRHSAEDDVLCRRCQSRLTPAPAHRNRLTQAFTLSALVFYIPAMLLPMLYIERLGHATESSLLGGVITLWSQGHWLVSTIVLLFSVLLPPLKLIALALLSWHPLVLQHSHKALLYRSVEFLGRWSMLDVMLVAILVAFVKLGDLVNIQPGNGLIAFIALVLCSLLASFAFNPKLMWAISNKSVVFTEYKYQYQSHSKEQDR